MTTMTVDQARRQLAEKLRSDQPYDFIAGAEQYLGQVTGDVEIRLRTVQEYLRLGLIAPARDLLADSGADDADAVEEMDALRESLRRVDVKPVCWNDLAPRFESNLTALTARGVDVDAIRDAWTARRGDFELWTDRNRATHVRRRDASGRWSWAPFFADHKALEMARAMPEDVDEAMPGPYVFEGLNFGWYFDRVHGATTDTFLGYSCGLFVVEPDLAALAIPLHLHDWRNIIADPRVYWHVGDGCVQRFLDAFERNHDLPLPRQAFHFSALSPERRSAVVPALRTLIDTRDADVRRSLESLNAQYGGRDLAHWADRFSKALSGDDKPLRVLGVVSRHTTFLKYSMRDVQRALEELGHECRVLTEHNDHTVVGALTQHCAIREFDPDVFFVIDHLRPEFPAIVPDNLPVFTWDQDQLPHVITAENFRKVADIDYLVGYSKYQFVRAGCDPRQYRYAGLPTSPHHFHTTPLTDDERRRFTCDVSYVSHASQTPAAYHAEERRRLPDAQSARLLDAMFERLPPMLAKHKVVGWKLPAIVLDQAQRESGVAVRDPQVVHRLQWWYLWRLGDRIFRHEALEWVAAWARRTGRSFRIYGNGWDQHPTLAEFAAGPADNDRELHAICKASSINLQLMPAGFIHQRALDGLAAGGFFLTRSTPHDTRGGVLRRLIERIDELAINDTAGLWKHDDDELRTHLRDYLGEWFDHYGPDDKELLNDLRIQSEWVYADEAFPDYRDIAFDGAESFEQRAERFLADEAQRATVAHKMREVVIDRFTYRAAMSGFLRDMAAYLAAKAGENAGTPKLIGPPQDPSRGLQPARATRTQ